QVTDLVVSDLRLPDLPGSPKMDGIEFIQHVRTACPETVIVMITGYGTIEDAVKAIRIGAYNFVTKPFDQTDLLNVVRKAVSTHIQRQKEPISLAPQPNGPMAGASDQAARAISSITGNSPQMQEIFKVITKIAPSPSTVLLRGESGTGKELVAYEIHRNSHRASKPFIKINCAAIPATLIESELFGHERGAFTGAVASKPGRFELAHDGTLFLDEVADMPLEMQVKLLRVLQEHEFQRVGGVNTIKVDVRIIAATNKDLDAEIKAGRFREDLFYRLNVVPIVLPPLRERRADIDLLIRFFVQQFREKLGKDIRGIATGAMAALRAFNWPGNIRQLENVLERMILMSEGTTLEVSDLPDEIAHLAKSTDIDSSEGPLTFKEIVRKQTQSVERDLIEKALEETNGNVTKTAEKLGLSRKGLQLKMKELGIKRDLD
ncbi:MAG: sigma-54 dependent transcriptional regulator, partial [Bdellovibrionota bacterium]